MLVRRVAKKGDFLRYVVYEMGLEELRKKRKTRMSTGCRYFVDKFLTI